MSIATWALGRRHARRTDDHPISTRRVAIVIALSVCAAALSSAPHVAQEKQEPVDVLIIGAGIAGLSAALEAARGGASVLVVDMSTVGGGHAILSNGAVSIVGTPLQEQQKIADSPALAEKDFLARGEDNDTRWVAVMCATHGNGSTTGSRISVSPSRVLHVPRAIPSPGFT